MSSAAVGGKGGGGYDPNLSVSSLGSRAEGPECEYMGTRTVAARVVSESFITSKQREQARMEGKGLKVILSFFVVVYCIVEYV